VFVTIYEKPPSFRLRVVQRRDWIGTVLVAVMLVLIAADLHQWLNVVLTPVIVILVVALVWDVKFGGISRRRPMFVSLDREEPHSFDYRALILGVKITIRNNTDAPRALRGFSWVPIAPWALEIADIDSIQEKAKYEKGSQRIPGVIPAHDQVSGWLWVAFAHRFEGGMPGYTLTVEDELGNRFPIRKEPRLPKVAKART
jgi:hypothetical protein